MSGSYRAPGATGHRTQGERLARRRRRYRHAARYGSQGKAARGSYADGLTRLLGAAVDVLAETSEKGILATVVKTGREIVGARLAAAWSTPGDGTLRLKALSCSTCTPLGSGWRDETCRPRIIEAFLADEERLTLRLSDEDLRGLAGHLPPGHPRLRGLLCARLSGAGGMATGLVTLSEKSLGEFTEMDELLIGHLASLASLGLRHIAARRESEDRAAMLDTVIDTMPDGLIAFDAAHEIFCINPAARRLLDLTPEEERLSPAERCALLEARLPDGMPLEIDDLPARRAMRGEEVRGAELLFGRRGRPPRPVSFNAVPIRDAGGAITGCVTTFQDIGHLKAMEMELRRAKEQADSASQAKSEFLATMSHEIRNPLSCLIALNALALECSPPPRVETYLRLARQAGQGLLDVVNGILDLSRIEAGRLDLDYEPFSLQDAVEAVLEPIAAIAEARGLSVTSFIGPAVPASLLGDRARLRQILGNLAGNALKFTEQGGMTLTIRLDESPPGPGQVRLLFQVRDTGHGIPEHELKDIFEKFTRGLCPDRADQGTGLGLAIARHLVERMDGRIWAESEPGRGSTFSFTVAFGLPFPAVAEPQAPYGAPGPSGLPPRPPRPLRPLRILLAEDDPINQLLATEILSARGHSVVIAENGHAALDALAKDRFDVVLMDVRMPRMSGEEATRRIRAGEAGDHVRNIPVIALTAHALKDDRERFLATGMSDYLTKPLELEKLLQALAKAVDM